MSDTVLTHCQICGRSIRAKAGVIAHHGYLRPGQGWQTSSCFGARFRPYEVASDALPLAISRVVAYAEAEESALGKLLAEPPATLTWIRRDAYKRVLAQREVGRPAGFDAASLRYTGISDSYEFLFAAARNRHQANATSARAEQHFLKGRLEGWRAQ